MRYRDGWFKYFDGADDESQRMQRVHHIDTAGYSPRYGTEYIDEKIMRRRNDGGHPVNLSCETISCSVPGLEARGWIYNDQNPHPTWLNYCFADAQVAEEVTKLECLWIPFDDFRQWFFSSGEERWPLHIEPYENKTHSRNIPIKDIMAGVPRCVAFELNLNGKHHVTSKQFEFVSGVWP
jgi:hypothetical protein